MTKDPSSTTDAKLSTIIELLQQLLALELVRSGATHQTVAKNLHLAKATVGKMLRGVKKQKNEE